MKTALTPADRHPSARKPLILTLSARNFFWIPTFVPFLVFCHTSACLFSLPPPMVNSPCTDAQSMRPLLYLWANPSHTLDGGRQCSLPRTGAGRGLCNRYPRTSEFTQQQREDRDGRLNTALMCIKLPGLPNMSTFAQHPDNTGVDTKVLKQK